jgi:hypothetical protein
VTSMMAWLEALVAARGSDLHLKVGSPSTPSALAAMIDHVNANNAVHIVTIEDPIEVLHTDTLGMVNQREVRVDTDDFTIAMRAGGSQEPGPGRLMPVSVMRQVEHRWPPGGCASRNAARTPQRCMRRRSPA